MMPAAEFGTEDALNFVDNVARAIEEEMAAVEGEDDSGKHQDVSREAARYALQWLIDSGYFAPTED